MLNHPVVVGGGAFGSAIAAVLARRGTLVKILLRDESQCQEFNRLHVNAKYLPDIKLPEEIHATTDGRDALASADVVFLAVPSHSIESVLNGLIPCIDKKCVVINLAKGLNEQEFTLDNVLRRLLPDQIIGCLKGPNFARPLINRAPSGMTLALSDDSVAKSFSNLFKESSIQLEYFNDLSSVEFISAVKNVLAVVMGMCDAIEDNPNTRFMVLKNIISEAKCLVDHFGYSPDVIFTFAGLGDMLMTSLNDSSRNRTLGLLIGRGFDFSSTGAGPVTEGRKVARLLHSKLAANSAGFPLVGALNAIFHNELKPQEFYRQITKGNFNV